LPAVKTSNPASLNIFDIKRVVVVFPLVPVIATISPLVNLLANSISDIIGIFSSLIFLTSSLESLIPGLFTINSELIILEKLCLFSSHSISLLLKISLV